MIFIRTRSPVSSHQPLLGHKDAGDRHPSLVIDDPGACLASELRAGKLGGACEVDGNVPGVDRCVLGPLEVSIKNTDERVSRQVLKTGVDRELVLTFFPW